MGRTWVLHTETKGTGAQMVPLEDAAKETSPSEPVFVRQKNIRPRERRAPAPRVTRRFKVVDVMTRQELASGASARETLDLLKDLRSIVDVNVYSWQEERARWRLLTLAEQRTMWERARES